jgi:hypothetical protein
MEAKAKLLFPRVSWFMGTITDNPNGKSALLQQLVHMRQVPLYDASRDVLTIGLSTHFLSQPIRSTGYNAPQAYLTYCTSCAMSGIRCFNDSLAD